MSLRPQKSSGQDIPEEYKCEPEQVENYPSKYSQNLTQEDNFGEKMVL